MHLRPFRESDRASVIALWRAAGLLRPWNDPERDIDRKVALNDELFVVGEDAAGVLVAVVMIGYDGHRGWVYYLAVDPDCQGQGLGRVLMQAAEHRLLALGCPKLNLQVRVGNESVLAFYRALGYEVDAAVGLGKRLIVDGD